MGECLKLLQMFITTSVQFDCRLISIFKNIESDFDFSVKNSLSLLVLLILSISLKFIVDIFKYNRRYFALHCFH